MLFEGCSELSMGSKYDKIVEDFEKKRKSIQQGATKEIVLSCESVFPLMINLKDILAERWRKEKKPKMDDLDAIIYANFQNQIYSLISAYELRLKSLISSSNAIIRIILETLVRDLFLLYNPTPENIDAFMKGLFPDSTLSESEKANVINVFNRKFGFGNCRQGLYQKEKDEGLRRAYSIF